ncbi:MAG TPA: hypothetical protein VGD87_06515 [Archangium sp.]
MSVSDLERIEALNTRLKAGLTKRGAKPLPSLVTLKETARMLSVSAAEMKELAASGVVLTVGEGSRMKVPRSEIDRLSTPSRPKVLLSLKSRIAMRAMQKTRAAPPGASKLAVRVRAVNREPKPRR